MDFNQYDVLQDFLETLAEEVKAIGGHSDFILHCLVFLL